jgi:hypothetical protein
VAGARAILALDGVELVASTDAQGRFELQPSGSGKAGLEVEAAGFAPVSLTVDVAGTSIELAPVVLSRPSFSDAIVVVAAGAETRLGDTAASVVALPAEQLWVAGATTVDGALRQVPGFALFRRSGSRTANPTAQGVSLRGVGASGASRAVVIRRRTAQRRLRGLGLLGPRAARGAGTR